MCAIRLTSAHTPKHAPRYGRRRLLPAEVALRRRATRWCIQTRWRLIVLNYPGVLRVFRDQQRMLHRERWAAHRRGDRTRGTRRRTMRQQHVLRPHLQHPGLDGGRQSEDVLHAIITHHQPDIVALQELRDDTLLKRLARTLHAEWFFARGNTRYHLGLLSRFPITHAFSYHRWPIRTALLEATIALPDQHLHLWRVHLMPHLGVPFELWRVAEVRVLMQPTHPFQHEPCVIAGDWNAIAPGDRVLVHALPPALRGVVLAQGGRTYSRAIAGAQREHWVDCYRRIHPHTAGWTLPSHQPNARLDYVFANPVLAASLRDCSLITTPMLVRTASDHLPLQAVFAPP